VEVAVNSQSQVNVSLTVDQVLEAVLQLDNQGKSMVVKALMAEAGDQSLAELIRWLEEAPPGEAVDDQTISDEITAVRKSRGLRHAP
jgi:hypothetical protein